MKTIASKPRRTGRSLMTTPQACPKATMLTLGLSEGAAERIAACRRVLPYVEESERPYFDARKLWERIGKPWGKFASWCEHEQRTFSAFMEKGQVEKRETPTKGRPRIDYLISRDCAAHLAMLAGTAEGNLIRSYFLDMEALALKLAAYMPTRAKSIITIDNEVTHTARVRAGRLAKDGMVSKSEVSLIATDMECNLKTITCEVVTGYSAGAFAEQFGGRVRDVLVPDDLDIYARAYDVAAALFRAGASSEQIKNTLRVSFGGRVDTGKYVVVA